MSGAAVASFSGSPDLVVEAELERRVRNTPSRETLHSRGLLRLAQGRLEEAIQDLTAARLYEPERIDASIDLTVAHLERFRAVGNPRDLLNAAELAVEAFERDPSSPPAVFNLALTLEALQLKASAADELNRYLRLDPSSDWAEEARRRLDRLQAPTLADRWSELELQLDVTDGSDSVAPLVEPPVDLAFHLLEYAAESLVPEWAQAVDRGRMQEAEAIRRRLHDIGEVLARSARDQTILVTLSATEHSVGGEPGSGAALRAFEAWGEATSAVRAKDCVVAEGALEIAEPQLRELGSPLGEWAAYQRGVCAYYSRIPGAVRRFRSLRARILDSGGSFPMLLGRVEWMLGLATTGTGDWAAALPIYHSAEERFRSAGDAPGQAGIYALLTEAHKQLGRSQEAWETRLKGLAAVGSLGDPKYRVRALNESLRAILAENRLTLAKLFQAELVREARAWDGGEEGLAEALVTSAQLFRRLGQKDEAEAALDEAVGCAERLPFDSLRTRLTANVEAERALLLAEVDPFSGAALLTQTLASFEEIGYHTRTPALLNARARALLALGDERGAEADLEDALVLIEERRETPGDEASRISFFETFQESYDAMVRFQASRAGTGPARAFAYADLSRGRALQDRLARVLEPDDRSASDASGFADPTLVDHLQEALPPGVALVQYSVLPEALLIWVVRRDHFEFIQRPISARDLRLEVELFVRMLERSASSSQLRALGASLYNSLVEPVRERVASASELVIVPDRFLARVPFAALSDPKSDRWLFETHTLSFAPGARLLVTDGSLDRDPGRELPTLLAIAADGFDRNRFPDLGPLPDVSAEAREVAALYRSAEVLAGREATPTAFLNSLGSHSVLHFAGHAVVGGRAVDDLQFVLAPEATGSGRSTVSGADLSPEILQGVDLAFLSACSTVGLSTRGEREGISGIARELLAAGVPAIVASSRPVADRPAAAFAVAFHRALVAGTEPNAALRAAQLELIGHDDAAFQAPSSWATYQLYRRSLPSRNRGES